MSYNNVNNIAEAELAGCLPIVEDLNNYEVLRGNLEARLALHVTRYNADILRMRIEVEASSIVKLVPPWEYVINELQYEFRFAEDHMTRKKMNPDYESRLIDDWAKHIIKRKGVDTALDFITILKNNRLKRVRQWPQK